MSSTLTVGSVILPARLPIQVRIDEARSPVYGSGDAPMCEQCVEKLKQDVCRRIVDRLKKISLPSVVTSGQKGWSEIIDLLKIEESYAKRG